MSRNKAIFCVVLCALLLAGCSQKQNTVQVTEEYATAPEASYKTTTVTKGTFSLSEKCSGTFVYTENATLYCEYPNAILVDNFNLRAGQEIKSGDVLATFTFDVSEAELQRLELAYEEAYRVMNETITQYQRTIDSYAEAANAEGNAGKIAALQKEKTQNELEQYRRSAEANVLQKKEDLESYRELFSTKTLIAPEDGIISWAVSMNAGAYVGEGTAMLAYYKEDTKYLKAGAVSSEFLEMVSPGMTVLIADNSKSVEGTVVASPAGIDELAGNSDVYVACDHFEDLNKRSSYSIICTILELPDMLMLDEKAIHSDGAVSYVYVLQDGVAVRRNVLCGLEDDGIVCIIDGLTEGQQVILN